MRKNIVASGLLLLCLAGCPSPAPTAPADLTAPAGELGPGQDLRPPPDQLSPGADLLNAGYPAGPYGNQEGDTIAPLRWSGYAVPAGDALATTKPYGSFGMNDLRLSGARLALVHASDDF